MNKIIADSLSKHKEALALLESSTGLIEQIAACFIETLQNKNKIIFMGNGGSAADAQHLAAELIGRFKLNRAPLASLALSTNTSSLTAIANDFGFNDIFLRQIEALTQPGDCVVGLSTSGKSKNVRLAISKARQIGAKTVAFLGRDGGDLISQVDLPLVIAINDTPRIQEMHIFLGHIICEIVEQHFTQ